ncbi:hypothetical protein K505DRAFT_360509 [Melanomma pulvis-pyrius CBS 109.77]|uniref:Uncharacterized protein n=1 Tax=Melanomma pulvis-pyrius CBS 109.77 TaxID=1314802 RepID=A0A6A6XEY2_9PLEO|nr:hypothetical protein K505DRAFT_360509 [Melanomma pulvis-pyrius CBS 109.77]
MSPRTEKTTSVVAKRTPAPLRARTKKSVAVGKISPRVRIDKTASEAASKMSLRARVEQACRVTKKWGHKAKVEAKKLAKRVFKTAERFLDEIKGPDLMDVDTEDDNEAYDILEKYRQVSCGFEYWSSDEGYSSFESSECLSAAKTALEEAIDLLELSDPDAIDINKIWDLSPTLGWAEFLEGNAVSKEQKGLKREVDTIISILRQRMKIGTNLSCLLFPTH